MAAVKIPALLSYFLVVLIALHCSPSFDCYASPEISEANHVVKWSEGNWYFVRSRRSSNEETKKAEFEDAGSQATESLEKDSRHLGRSKRDIQEIIAGRPVNFPPVVIKRTTDALKLILALLGDIEKALNTVTTTPSPPQPTTLQPVVVKTSTRTPPPLTNSSGEIGVNVTAPPPNIPPALANATAKPAANSTEAPAGTSPTPPKNESTPIKPSEKPPTVPASNPTKGLPPVKGDDGTLSTVNILGDQVRSQVRASDVEQNASASNSTPTLPPIVFSPWDVINILQVLSEHAENVMADRLNMSTVIAIEKNVEILTLVNKTAAYISRGDGMSELKIWLTLVQMSCTHALKKLVYGKQVMALFGNSDDITILITAAFCTLALICCIVACLVGNRPLKPTRGDYRLGGTPGTTRPVPSTRRHISSASSDPPEQPFSVYSSPARAAVSARSNPSYSSHRSVDVDPSASYRPAENNLNYDEPRPEDEDSVTDATVAAKNERNANLGKDRPVSTKPRSRISDYKDPRRHRSNLARGRSNEGYSGDEVIGVRSDSESVL